uniref:All-trans retinoic acid induced differentiation factor n=1 Tax=Apteryx owenii TaxID=8824 RepID=A0A8B9NRB6_APTOW
SQSPTPSSLVSPAPLLAALLPCPLVSPSVPPMRPCSSGPWCPCGGCWEWGALGVWGARSRNGGAGNGGHREQGCQDQEAGAGLSAPPQLRAVFRSAVPLYLECPGGSSAWEQVTTHGSSRLCQGQRNPCNSSGELGRLCPENALCAPDGPGLSQCLCSSPFHGYKCLREDAFPVLLFCGVLGAVTAVLSLLLWSTQRRKAKAP